MIRNGSLSEHETPTQEVPLGRHGSPAQPSGLLLEIASRKSSITITAEHPKKYIQRRKQDKTRQDKTRQETFRHIIDQWAHTRIAIRNQRDLGYPLKWPFGPDHTLTFSRDIKGLKKFSPVYVNVKDSPAVRACVPIVLKVQCNVIKPAWERKRRPVELVSADDKAPCGGMFQKVDGVAFDWLKTKGTNTQTKAQNIIHIPNDISFGSEATPRDIRHHIPLEIGRVINRIIKKINLERRNKRARPIHRVLVPRKTNTQELVLSHHNSFVIRRPSVCIILRRVNNAPFRAVDYLIENRRLVSSVESPVKIDCLDECFLALALGKNLRVCNLGNMSVRFKVVLLPADVKLSSGVYVRGPSSSLRVEPQLKR
ncbi:zinc finger (CCCH-type) family protein / RNArecognition motif (RRM)-containing protein [Striga asiatica]|uniref:Zinc finger (CCCH-type) family protein / RNArecognition motif (RRM)-containing protein n=1 Tax=Striga asiatica TaxID=4170 RepID=A0A5A7RHK7_STRAF|nr:zinc finger (CCCH-type) family protein / RNArecognition motif (RRM)-containing protein [Striga asiatica]